LTGGTLFARTDGNSINGEIYEFGLLDRTLTAKEITSLETYAQAHYGRSWPTFGQVFIDGDSLCEGNGSTTLLCWPVTLDNNIGATYIQRSQALGGTSIQTQAGNASSNSGAYDGTLTKNIAFCWLGTNDIVAGARTSAQILADLQTWVTAFHGAGFKTIVGTILPRGDASGANETTRLAVNAGIPGLTSLDATCDIAGISQLSDPNNATYYQSDKIHLTDASYALVEALVRPAILAL
jgi:hypothetical protein